MEPVQKRIKLEDATRKMECVVDDSLTLDIGCVKVCIGRILDRKNTRSIILDLNSKHPIPSLSHLKRIKNDWIILHVTDTVDCSRKFLKDSNINCDYFGDFQIVEVPKSGPITRKQFVSANSKWPCNFHENKLLEKLVNNVFSPEEMDLHEKWMRIAVETAREAGRSCATVVVDSSNEIVAKSADNRNNHPIHHSVMLAVDLVSRSQGGGAWPLTPNIGQYNVLAKSNNDTDDGPYLCTGYDVYTTREPCIMCAMALIHSRAKRVFYGCSSKNGSLGSSTKIHHVKELNHHYQVFRGLLKEECEKLCDKSG